MTAGNSVYVFVTVYQSIRTVVPPVVDDGGVNTYSLVTGPDGVGDSSDGSTRQWIYKCENLVGAPTTITVPLDGNQYKQYTAVECTGGAAGHPVVDTSAFLAVAGGAPLVGPDITTSADNELLLGYVAQENGAYTYTAATGWTAVLTNSNPSNASSFLMSQAATTAGTYHQTGGSISSPSGTGNYSLAIQ
jgi:hypothetical protein